jgi:hypothetical protein
MSDHDKPDSPAPVHPLVGQIIKMARCIEGDPSIADTIWFTEHETLQDAIFRIADEVEYMHQAAKTIIRGGYLDSEIEEGNPTALNFRDIFGDDREPNAKITGLAKPAPVHQLVGQAICPVCNKPIEEGNMSSTGYIDYHRECNRV